MYSRYRALPFGAARLIYADKTVDIRIGEYMKVMFVSLGCDKNLVDTESMLGILRKHGYGFTDNEFEADVIVVNTCCFIDEAKQESVDTILSMAEHKKDGACKALLVQFPSLRSRIDKKQVMEQNGTFTLCCAKALFS